MKNKDYRPRIVDKIVDKYLNAFPSLCIEGPKWCGKTWTSLEHSESVIYIADPNNNFQNRNLAIMTPSMVLEGEKPRLIDEWQEVPELWDAIRFKSDSLNKKGQFILTGSATPSRKGILHSGAGRIARIQMSTMSLYESGDSSGEVSLKDLCNGNIQNKMTGEVDLRKIIEYIVRGGWPAAIGLPIDEAILLPKEYIEAILNNDIYRVDDVHRDEHKMRLLLRSLARNESTTASNRLLRNDIKERDEEDISMVTINDYLNIFNQLFLLDNQLPYSTNIRSSIRVKQMEKRHFCDPSLACALLNITPAMLLNDLKTLGFLFESLCERDLKIYVQSFNGHLYHYQDYRGNEIDSVIEMENGDWIAIEIKLGANQIENAAKQLNKIDEILKEENARRPSQKIIICGLSSAVYKRPDGIMVVPITALKD